MQKHFLIFVLICLATLSGCGNSSGVITNPKDLPPLTEKDKEEIKKLDQQILEEEGGAYLQAQKKKAAAKGR